jgi:hypothetical protein
MKNWFWPILKIIIFMSDMLRLFISFIHSEIRLCIVIEKQNNHNKCESERGRKSMHLFESEYQ